ncbi:MAG: cryptochrome/photolyase family protein [Prolixibacteraceae bacterium]|nr:cryptochrome/photolyase family protein [Prolixibacteraceae bacterium]
MTRTSIVFPHQLFDKNPCLQKHTKVLLIEEHLFFNQYRFHKQKLIFHRASMRFYEGFLRAHSFDVEYIDAQNSLSDIRKLIPELKKDGISEIYYTEVVDDWLEKRIQKSAADNEIITTQFNSPMFLNTIAELSDWFSKRKKLFHNDFYIHQRKKHKILLDTGGKPVGGKWSFDSENRSKYPKTEKPPSVQFPPENKFVREARKSISESYPENYGSIDSDFIYPTTFEEAKDWLDQFLKKRFYNFGKYEDAIVHDESILHHSVLSPLLNAGLLTPAEVLDNVFEFAGKNHIPHNSLEGFVRQIIGWREFIRGMYQWKGSTARSLNFWGFDRKIPESFWTGETGIEPLDEVIHKVQETAYAHHIERLMVIGNFMLLCEFNPDEVYRWFMEMFIDSYDWVMVPNVYSMSQFADGGLMATKPYISGSNYLKKMSDFKNGEWQKTWDSLFWRFMHVHRDFFEKNPRLNMLVRNFDKMNPEKQNAYLNTAEQFLKSI